jgi:hypothetical protein
MPETSSSGQHEKEQRDVVVVRKAPVKLIAARQGSVMIAAVAGRGMASVTNRPIPSAKPRIDSFTPREQLRCAACQRVRGFPPRFTARQYQIILSAALFVGRIRTPHAFPLISVSGLCYQPTPHSGNSMTDCPAGHRLAPAAGARRRATLERWIRARLTPQRTVLRSRIVCLADGLFRAGLPGGFVSAVTRWTSGGTRRGCDVLTKTNRGEAGRTQTANLVRVRRFSAAFVSDDPPSNSVASHRPPGKALNVLAT